MDSVDGSSLHSNRQRTVDLDLEVVAVNELGALPTMRGLLARDSVHGRFGPSVTAVEGGLESEGTFFASTPNRSRQSCPGGNWVSTW